MKVHHLSHIDLDGYGAQFVAREFFKNITFYNANYGKEVSARLKQILQNIAESTADSGVGEKYLILITDLNLTLSEAKFLQGEADLLNARGKKTQILLLDHHITGKDCAQNYAWYHLDERICATKITLNYLLQNYATLDADFAESGRNEEKMQRLAKFVDVIDSADTWKEDGFGFEFGKVALGMIAQSREFSRYMFEGFDNEFRFSLLEKACEYLLDSAGNMRENAAVELDNNIFLFKKDILGGERGRQTMEQILSHKQAELLAQNKQKYLINIAGKKGIVTYGIGGISVVANLFLRQNADLDFFIDVGLRGNVSLRANGNCDVSEMAKEYFGGGGHKNAAGGRIDGFKETFLYKEAKAQLEAKIGLGADLEDDDDEQWGL